MDVMTKQEHVQVDSLVGHGGIFTTPKVALGVWPCSPITCGTPMRITATSLISKPF